VEHGHLALHEDGELHGAVALPDEAEDLVEPVAQPLLVALEEGLLQVFVRHASRGA